MSTLDALREAEPVDHGKRSILSTLQKSLGSLEPDERRDAGAQLQEARREVEAALERRRAELSRRRDVASRWKRTGWTWATSS